MAKFDLGGAVSTHNLLAASTPTTTDEVYKSQPNLSSSTVAAGVEPHHHHRSLHGLLTAAGAGSADHVVDIRRRPLVALVMEPASAMGLLAEHASYGSRPDPPAPESTSPSCGFKSSFAKECAQASSSMTRGHHRSGGSKARPAVADYSPPPSPYVRPPPAMAPTATRRFSSNLQKYRVKQQVSTIQAFFATFQKKL